MSVYPKYCGEPESKNKKDISRLLDHHFGKPATKTLLIILKINLINEIVKILFMHVAFDTLGFNRKAEKAEFLTDI